MAHWLGTRVQTTNRADLIADALMRSRGHPKLRFFAKREQIAGGSVSNQCATDDETRDFLIRHLLRDVEFRSNLLPRELAGELDVTQDLFLIHR